MKLSKKGWALFISISLLLPALGYAAFNWYNNTISDLPYYGENYTAQSVPSGYTVPGFSFINQDSARLTNAFTNGKIWVAHYFFTSCPIICPRMMKGMDKVQETFAGNDKLRMVSFTVDPEHDHPSVLKAYAETRNIDSRQWQLLTGDKKSLYGYARKGLFIVATDGDGGDGDFIHSEKLVLVDSGNRIRGYYDGTQPEDIQLLINDINRLLKQ